MGKTFRRPPIKQHKDLLEDGRYASRVVKNKKKEKKNKHPKNTFLNDVMEFESESD